MFPNFRYTERLKKKLTLFKKILKKYLYNIFGKYLHVWMAKGLFYHMTPKTLKISHAWASTGHICLGHGNKVCARLGSLLLGSSSVQIVMKT